MGNYNLKAGAASLRERAAATEVAFSADNLDELRSLQSLPVGMTKKAVEASTRVDFDSPRRNILFPKKLLQGFDMTRGDVPTLQHMFRCAKRQPSRFCFSPSFLLLLFRLLSHRRFSPPPPLCPPGRQPATTTRRLAWELAKTMLL